VSTNKIIHFFKEEVKISRGGVLSFAPLEKFRFGVPGVLSGFAFSSVKSEN